MRNLSTYIVLLFTLLHLHVAGQQALHWNSRNFLEDTSRIQLTFGNQTTDFSTNVPLAAWAGKKSIARHNVYAHYEHAQDILNLQFRTPSVVLAYSATLFQRNTQQFNVDLFNILYNGAVDSVGAQYAQYRMSSVNHTFYGERKFGTKLHVGISLHLHAQNSINIRDYQDGVVDNRNGEFKANFNGRITSFNTPVMDSASSPINHNVPLSNLEFPHVGALLTNALTPSLGFFISIQPTSYARIRLTGQRIGPNFFITAKEKEFNYSIAHTTTALRPEDVVDPLSDLTANYQFNSQGSLPVYKDLQMVRQPALFGGSFEVDYSERIAILTTASLTFYPEYIREQFQLLTKIKASDRQYLLAGIHSATTHQRFHHNLFLGISSHLHKRLILFASTETALNMAFVQRQFGPAPMSRHQIQITAQITIP